MKKYILKKIILSGIFIFLSFLLMVIVFPMIELKPFPSRFYIDLLYLLTISIICFTLPLFAQESIQIFLLLVEAIILFTCASLYISRGDIFKWNLLSQINQLKAVKDMIQIPVWLIFVDIAIIISYMLCAIFIKTKNIDVKKFYSWVNITIATSCLIVCSCLNILSHKQLVNNYDKENYYTSDAFMFESHHSSFACLQSFGFYGYYTESFFRYLLPFTQPEVKTFDYTYENYTTILNGLCEDNNVIMIYAESFDIYGISKELTPTLWAMKNGIDLTNCGISEFYNIQTENGKTTLTRKDFNFDNNTNTYTYNGLDIYNNLTTEQVGLKLSNYQSKENTGNSEIKALTGNFVDFNYSLPSFLNNYKTSYIHGNTNSFYGRNVNMSKLGFKNTYFSEDMTNFIVGPGSACAGALNCVSMDSETMRYCTDNPNEFNLFPTDENFFTFFMTVTTHGRYEYNALLDENYKMVDAIANSEFNEDMFNLYNSSPNHIKQLAREYFARALDTEYALSYIINYLYQNDILDKTIITFTGDHVAYANDILDFKDLYVENILHKDKYELCYNVEGFIYSSNITASYLKENNETRDIDDITEPFDLLPTILSLLKIDYAQDKFMRTPVINKSALDTNKSLHSKVILAIDYGFMANEKFTTIDGKTIKSKNPNYNPTEAEIIEFKKNYNAFYEKYYHIKKNR